MDVPILEGLAPYKEVTGWCLTYDSQETPELVPCSVVQYPSGVFQFQEDRGKEAVRVVELGRTFFLRRFAGLIALRHAIETSILNRQMQLAYLADQADLVCQEICREHPRWCQKRALCQEQAGDAQFETILEGGA